MARELAVGAGRALAVGHHPDALAWVDANLVVAHKPSRADVVALSVLQIRLRLRAKSRDECSVKVADLGAS